MLADKQLEGVLINTQHNFSWLTCGGSNAIDISRENGAGFLFVTRKGTPHVIANNIELPRLLSEEIPPGEFEPIEISWQSEKDPRAVIEKARAIVGDTGEIGCDIGFPETRWIEPSVASCRHQLTPDEIVRYRALGRDAGEALANTTRMISPGQTENEIARIVRNELAKFGAFTVVTLVAADDRISKYRHPIPTEHIWRNTLLIVVCTRRQGLIANLSRMIVAGPISADLQHRTEAAAAVNAALYAATTPGISGSQLYEIAARVYAEQGFPGEINKHHQGGATGYRTRDWVAHPTSHDAVKPDQAFAWNPSITGTKTEETGILTAEGFEVITATDGWPTISTVVDGREFLSPGILSLGQGASA